MAEKHESGNRRKFGTLQRFRKSVTEMTQQHKRRNLMAELPGCSYDEERSSDTEQKTNKDESKEPYKKKVSFFNRGTYLDGYIGKVLEQLDKEQNDFQVPFLLKRFASLISYMTQSEERVMLMVSYKRVDTTKVYYSAAFDSVISLTKDISLKLREHKSESETKYLKCLIEKFLIDTLPHIVKGNPDKEEQIRYGMVLNNCANLLNMNLDEIFKTAKYEERKSEATKALLNFTKETKKYPDFEQKVITSKSKSDFAGQLGSFISEFGVEAINTPLKNFMDKMGVKIREEINDIVSSSKDGSEYQTLNNNLKNKEQIPKKRRGSFSRGLVNENASKTQAVFLGK